MQDLPHLAVALMGLKPGLPRAVQINWSEFPASVCHEAEAEAAHQRGHKGALVWCVEDDAAAVAPAPRGDPAWVQRLPAQPAPVETPALPPVMPPVRSWAPRLPAEVRESADGNRAVSVPDHGERPRWVELLPARTAGDLNVLDCNRNEILKPVSSPI